MSHQRTQSTDLYRENEFVLKQPCFHLCIGTNLVRWCPVKANGSQIHFSVWEVTDSLHKKLSLTFFLRGGIVENEHFIFVFLSGILMTQKRPIYFNSWYISQTETTRFQFSLLSILIKVFFEGFFVNRKPTNWTKLFFFWKTNFSVSYNSFRNTTGQNSGKELLAPTHFNISTHFFQKIALNSFIKVWFHDVIQLNDSQIGKRPFFCLQIGFLMGRNCEKSIS